MKNVTATRCSACGTRLVRCVECGELFAPKRADQVYCRGRCRTRRLRRLEEMGFAGELGPQLGGEGAEPEQ